MSAVPILLSLLLACQENVSFEEKRLSVWPKAAGFLHGDFIVAPNGKQVAYVVGAEENRKLAVVVGDSMGEPFDSGAGGILFSRDGAHVAHVEEKGGKQFVVLDGKRSEPYDRVNEIQFITNSGRLAYGATVEKTSFVVIDGKKGEPFDYAGFVAFSPDGKSFAYGANSGGDSRTGAFIGGKYFIVVGDKKGEPFDDIFLCDSSMWNSGSVATARVFPLWSPDGTRVAYAAGKFFKQYVVVGDSKSEEFERVNPPVFSSDGKRVAFRAIKLGKTYVVIDGAKGEGFEDAKGPLWSPSSNDFVYFAQKADFKWVLRSGAKVVSELGWDPQTWPMIGKDGRTIVATTHKGGRVCLTIGDKPGEGFEQVSPPIFSPDGGHVAYVAQVAQDQRVMVVDERKGEALYRVGAPVWSPDSKTVAYSASESPPRGGVQKQFVVIGARRGAEFQNVGDPVFAPDGKTVAHAACLRIEPSGAETWCIVVGSAKGPEVDKILGLPIFSADGKKVAYAAKKGAETWWKVLDVAP